MRIKTIFVPVIIVGILMLGIFISKTLGCWQTTSSKIPETIKEGDYAGYYNPADIRGSYTLADIEAAFQVPAVVIAEAFGVENNHSESMQVKELENIYGELGDGMEIGTASIRYFVALYTNLPYDDISEVPYLTEKAVEILTERQCIANDTEIRVIPNALLIKENNDTVHDETTSEDNFVITGQTTIKELIDQGIIRSDLEKLLGLEINNINVSLKSICTLQGLNFGDIKNQVMTWMVK